MVVESTGKSGQCGCDPSLPYRLLWKDYKFALLLLKRKRKQGGKEEAVTIVWGDRQKKAGVSKNAPQQPPPT